MLVGDRRRYCSLLVVPDFDALGAWAAENGIQGDPETLATHPKVVAHVETELFAMLGDYASFERPKKLAILVDEFSVENGLLTPTLKVRRKAVHEQLDEVIDALYAGS